MIFFIIIITEFFIKRYLFQNYPDLFRTQIRYATAGNYNSMYTYMRIQKKKEKERARARKKKGKQRKRIVYSAEFPRE